MDEKKVREAIGRLQVGINAKREMIRHNKAFSRNKITVIWKVILKFIAQQSKH